VNRHRRHQCPTCVCTDVERLVMDPSAPFFGLVVEIDRIFLAEQLAAQARTKAAAA
jgi:hypothetical protein